LQIEARNRGNRDPTWETTEATLPEKAQGFAAESVFKPEFTCSRPVTLPNISQQLLDDDDDVVDMMVRMLPMTIVCNSEVFLPNFL
jgi:hypothetical protein